MSNWVEQTGGLPAYIDRVAKAIRRKHPDWTRGRCIATAVEKIRRWLATSKDPKVKAKCAEAIAQWERMRAQARATK